MMNIISRYKRYFLNSFMFKLIISYSIIIIFTLAILTFAISQNFSTILKQKEINFENQIIRRVSDYLDNNISSSKKVIQQIYMSDANSRNTFFRIFESDEQEITFDYLIEKNTFDNLFSSVALSDNDIQDIIIYKSNTNEVFAYSKNSRKIMDDFNFKRYSWFREIFENGETLRIIPSYTPEYIKNDKRLVYSTVVSISNANNKTIGVIIINFDARKLGNSYIEYEKNIKGSIMVLDKTGNVVYDSSNKYYGRKYQYFSLLKTSANYVMLDKESIVSVKESNNNGLIVVGIISKSQILRDINTIIRTIYFIMIICLFFSIVLTYIISNFFSKKIRNVIIAMKEVEKGNLKTRIPLGKAEDEIGEIYKNFNKMCERLESYIDKVYLAEIKMKDASLQHYKLR